MATPDPARAQDLARQTIRQEMDALRALAEKLDERFWVCADLLCQCQGLIWVTGVGTSAAIGSRFAHILTDCGARSMFLSPSDGLHGHSAIMGTDDLLVALSRGGESTEVTGMVEIARRRGATTVALVHDTSSTLARRCDVVLPVRSEQSYELLGYVATTSTVAFCAMCDALSAVVLEAKGYTLAQLGQAHPGGAVGHALAGEADR
jgi:arabinose-5-phosphate isomerase